ncbi:titin isoform X3 [Hylaeus anthracinus]|uniref:titin isoform X3 n=1 Tax=Hylaeus anthracinus TaxID=313031 RepID=UPI0023B8E8C0|nr:titin isoform X3 [Hylaeus anthracinus]
MPTKNLEAVDILEALESKLAYIPGGRDPEGRPLIVVNVPSELQPTTKPRLECLFAYFLSIFSEETKRNGLVLIVDARKGAWRVARSCIRLSMMLLGPSAASVVVVRPEGFWDKRVDSCTRSHKEGEPTYITLGRLPLHVDFAQLPYELGGNKLYDHTEWIQNRVKVEDYNKDASDLIARMTDVHRRLTCLNAFRMSESDEDLESYWEMSTKLTSVARHILQSGRNLVTSMSRDSAKDALDTTKGIHELMDSIELKKMDIENSWSEMERNLDTARVIGDLEKGVSRVTDWILGPADAMLNSCCQVGFDVSSSEELRRRHEELELECRETYGRYAELLHKIDSLPSTRLSEDLKSQRDFMDFVCRSFASRLERRRNVLITSQRFFRLVSEYFDKTSDVFDKLVMGNRTHDFSQAAGYLLKLEQSQAILETLECELVKEGEKLSDILSMPVKDALGRDVQVDYGEDIVNVRDILDATNARKNIFNDSVELQKLSLKQIALIYTYESDAEQAVKWLNDLYDVLLKNHMEIGCNALEIQLQKEEHQSFQETAKGTYDYGCQLVNGARVLRLSCRLPLENNATLFSRLRQAWKQLRSVGQEQLTRLRVCAVFHRSVEDVRTHCSKLCDLIESVGCLRRSSKAEDLAAESRARAEIRDILGNREKLLLEVGRMVRLGRLLRTRLKEPLCHQRMSEAEDASGKVSNLTAVEAISARLAEVTRLAEKLDARLCEAGARTRPVPMSSSAMSSTSSLFSSSSVVTATTTAPSHCQPISAAITTTGVTNGSVIPLISSSTTTVQLQPKSISTILSAPVSTTKGAGTASFSSVAGVATSTPSVSADETISTSTVVERILSPVLEASIGLGVDAAKNACGGDSETRDGSSSERIFIEEGDRQEEDVMEVMVRSCDNSVGDDSNIEGYVTATECSTPTGRSRSASFVTSPECEDLSAPATVTSPRDAWWNTEDPKFIATSAAVSSSVIKQEDASKVPGIAEKTVLIEVSKPEVCKMNGEKEIEKTVSVEKRVEEKSGKIVKEVTETTTLRVSHDTRFGVTSYKVVSNTLQDHRENVDIKEMKDIERVVSSDAHRKTNGVHHETEPSSKTESYSRRDELSTKTDDTERMIKFTKICELKEEEKPRVEEKSMDASKDMTLSLKEYTRHHEDSGIEMSPTKKEDSIEGQDFLERARKRRNTRMVDGHDSMETMENGEGPPEKESRTVVVCNENAPQQTTTPTTTISTIAVQSGETRLVIALLQSGEWLRLKVLEVQPELTKLGGSLEEATEFSNAHDEVLLRLQSKQSPVEELLRQADQLISNQRPRAEVYAAMAETLGQAWRDVNELLERRKQILDSNVLFQCRAEECRENMRALEMACNDTLLPIEIEAVKNFLSKIHDLRKNMLEALMGALQEGKNLLDRLKEIANEGTLDSRPDRIKLEADHAVLKVERWLEELHDRRRLIETSFRSRKTQLEQCLALALLATDLRDLEEILNDRIAALSSTCDQLGDSASSAEILLFELKKLQAEAKEFQDRSIKITKSTERLVSSGHFAGEQATEQAYAILGAAADYVNDLDQYEALLNRAVTFFDSARSALTKLDQLEIQLVTTEHPPFSTGLARFHAQMVATIEDVTSKPLAEGYALLDVTGRGAPGAEGVKRTVEELENRKIRLMERCTAHEKENLEISRTINTFLDKRDELRKWLSSIPEAFLQGHQDMGSDVPMAEDFCRLHRQLLNDLERRSGEVRNLEFEILPIKDRLEESQKIELQSKVADLENSWSKTKDLVATRIDLGTLYCQFHVDAEKLTREIESIENELTRHTDVFDEVKVEELERRWKDLQPLYAKLSSNGKTFLDAAVKIDDPYLDVHRACLCVQTLLDKFANKQLQLKRVTSEILMEKRIEYERKIEESTKTLETITTYSEQLYPVIRTQSSETMDILQDLQSSKLRVPFELNKAVKELDSRIRSMNTLGQKGDAQVAEEIMKRLQQAHSNMRTTATDYEILLDSLISIFQNIEDIKREIDQLKIQAERVMSLKSIHEVETASSELDMKKKVINDRLGQLNAKTEEVVATIRKQEPPEAAAQDIEKLNHAALLAVIDFTFYECQMKQIEEHRRTCVFAEDLERIHSELHDLNEHLRSVDAKIGENLQVVRNAAASFVQFEKTVKILEERIETFIKTTEESVSVLTPQIASDISSLRERWRNLREKVEETKKRMNLSVDYFVLLEEAKDWNRTGSKLLMAIARKATMVKAPKDATELLQEIEEYLKPGEEMQEKRIEKLKQLSTIVFGTDRLPQFNEVIVENRQMLDSFAVVSSELRTLAENLRNTEDLREKLRIEKQETNEQLQAAKEVMAAAEAARQEAENARKIAEKLAAETLEKATMEAKKMKEERETQKVSAPPLCSVSAQTEKIETIKDGSFVKESVTSSITTKEIHILQKTEIEETVPVVQREPSPLKKVATKDIHEQSYETLPKEEVLPLAPEFSIPLNDATVQEGEKFTFQCNLIGHPLPEVVWYKDGISILNNPDYLTTYVQGSCTLTIEETFAEDSAKYTCRAFNIAGSAETTATLTVSETAPEEQPSPPVFVKELVPSVVTEGASLRMDCVVEGNPLPTVQWYKNDTNIDNSPDYVITYNNGEAVLKFDEVFLEDKATYTCKAANRLGQASTSASLTVEAVPISQEKPRFVTPLSNAMGRAGQRVKLECEATGTPMPTMTWYHDERPVEETTKLKIQTDNGRSSLVISEAFAKDAGCYMVAARNDAGEATVSCNVSVKGRFPQDTSDSELACSDMEPVVPKIQMPLKDHKAQEGRTVRLDCVIVGQPEPEVIWYHDEQPVKESADFQLLFQGDKCSLVIHEAFLDDAAVTVTDELDKARPPVEETFVPGSPPKFVKLPTDSLVAEGENAIFECTVTGEPKPELRWFLDNVEITANERILIKQSEDGTGILKISSAIPEDRGNYVVKAINVHGEAKAFARLVVRSLGDFRGKEEFIQMEEKLIAPTFKERFEDRSVLDGVSTKFECIVVGKPSPKIQWLFNDRPVHGKDFLVSVSGDRQVLTIPETESTHVGTISCVAENAAGKATCSARLEIGGWPREKENKAAAVAEAERVFELVERLPSDEMHASSSSDKHFSAEKTSATGAENEVLTKMSQIITESSTTHTTTKKEFVSSMMSSSTTKSGQEPTSVCVKTTVHSTEQASSENGAPPVVQSYKVEEHEKIIQDQPGEIRQEKTVVVSQDEEGIKRDIKAAQIPKPTRKSTAPRFVSPITGMIVDQDSDIVLEGIIDGFPQPSITWSKNGQELKTKDGMSISYAHNHVRLELKKVNVKDAGRYTCTASNEVGSASSTADLVVKKTIFPPVFGRRLQAQVVKRGDRVNMEVEITGTPEPTVTWFKDDIPIKDRPPELRIKQQGNCYMLIIDKANKEHAGKYMVRATNAGGEAQSIADFAVFEPTPDTMVEVHKTVIYENTQDKKILQSEKEKGEDSSMKQTSELLSTKTIQPSTIIKPPPSVTSSSMSQISRTVEKIGEPEMQMSRSETISSTVESHQMETKSEQKFHMKLEHKTPPVIEPKKEVKTMMKEVIREEKKILEPEATVFEEKTTIENENVETSTIAKKDALSFFESMTKETETSPKRPKEMIKLVDDTDGHEVKVGKLTKNYERSTTFQEVKKPEPRPMEAQTTKKAVHEIFTKLEQGTGPSRGVDNKLFDFPYESYKPSPVETKKTVVEETITSGSSSRQESMMMSTKMESRSESSEVLMGGFNLLPEPPPEIGYMPKPEEIKKKRPDVSIKAKQLQESFEKTLSPIDAPIGGVKIFPSPSPRVIEPPKFTEAPKLTPSFSMPPPPFQLEKKEIIEEVCVKRDIHEKKDKDLPSLRPISPSRPWSSSSDVETRSHISTDLSEYRCHSAASSHQETLRSTSPRPSADGLAMEKSWAKKCADSTRKSWPPQEEPVTKFKHEWQTPAEEYKTSSKEFKREVEELPEGGMKKTSSESSSTMERRSWSTKQEATERFMKRAPSPPRTQPIIYNAETIKVDHTVNKIEEKSLYEKYSSECDVKKSEVSEKIEQFNSKSRWTGTEDLKAPGLVRSVESPKKPVVQLYHLAEPALMVDQIILEPGPPPEIGYIPGPVVREKKVDMVEKQMEVSLEQHQPTKIPPGGIRTIPASPKREEPPALPPKDVRMTPPPLPAKTSAPIEPLEPFPFKPSPAPAVTKTPKVPPPPTPTKFVKGSFAMESDYESDMDSHLKSKWRPYESDNEEPRYRRVQPPVPKQPTRPRSTEPEPLPPSKFEVPPESGGLSRPLIAREQQEKICKKVTTVKRQEKEVKQQQKYPVIQPAPIELKPGSPPIYVQPTAKSPTPKSPPAKKPESPKFKVKMFQQESGYMADTDEPFQQKSSMSSMQKSFGKHESSSSTSHMESRSSYSESRSEFFESKSYESRQQQQQQQKMESFSPSVTPVAKQPPQQRSTVVEKSYSSSTGTCPSRFMSAKETVYTTDQSQKKFETAKKILPPSPSPSRFVKSEFRESDYESDYDGRIPPLWKPRGYESDDQSFRPVKPHLAGPGKPKEPPAPLIEEISTHGQKTKELEKKVEKTITTPTKPKTVLLPGSPPEMAYAPPQPRPTYYEARAGPPLHNAIGTETKKTVRMDESTENSRRVVTVEQTSRVIKFGDGQKTPADFASFDTQKPKLQDHFKVPMPKKFVQGQFRESDYESDIDTRIRPKWTPSDSDKEEPRYRKVQPPSAKSPRSSSAPVRQEHVVSPMEFDTGPPALRKQTSMTQLRDESRTRKIDTRAKVQRDFTSKRDETLKPGSPPEFGYVSRTDVRKAANNVASRHMTDMTSSFKSKTERFVNDIQSDLKQGKPILKHPTDNRASDGDEPRTYREESRLSEHGTKQIDPDTGLIYFKYDFGYEFGIVLPGEGKKTVTSTNRTIQGQRRASDIEVPIVHEFTTRKENGFAKRANTASSGRQGKPASKFGTSKTVKWEPTSESEFSEAEDIRNARKRHPDGGNTMAPPSLVIPCSPSPSRWDHTTPSPLSLSPSLPSLSPRYSSATGPPSNVDSAGSPWPTTNGVASSKEVIQPYLEILPKKAPLFITPLRDIAVVSGQTARFECIVQAEPQPNILWSKDGRIVENSSSYEIHYRNGVCRLTIVRAFPEDAGTYACTATNSLGSTVTSATLEVPGNRRSVYAPI